MSERPDEENQPEDRDAAAGQEPDLRSLLGGVAPRRVVRTAPEEQKSRDVRERVVEKEEEEDFAPPYVPPVREGDPVRPEPVQPDPARPDDVERPRFDTQTGLPIDEKQPPVWPGDEDQPWFRRERGLPPLSEEGKPSVIEPEDLPTPLADVRSRGRAWGITFLLPYIAGFLFAPFGTIFGTVILIPNLFLFRQGQDVGAVLFGLRVLRENGDVAGFYLMFVRNSAAFISFLALGAGFWGAFSDPKRRTWHDKWLGTYVVKDSKEYNTRKRSSSDNAFNWFWIIILLIIVMAVILALSGPVPAEMTPGDTPPAS